MSALSNAYELAVLDHLFRNVALTSPTTVYVGLFTSDPTDAGSGTQVSGGSYARVAATFAAASNGSITTSADIEFPTATGNWGTITHIGVFSSLSGSASTDLIVGGSLDVAKEILSGDTFVITTGNLTITLD
jgi:hypothetical protein